MRGGARADGSRPAGMWHDPREAARGARSCTICRRRVWGAACARAGYTCNPVPVAVDLKACTNCNWMLNGCVFDAKRSMLLNYLPAAEACGCEIRSAPRGAGDPSRHHSRLPLRGRLPAARFPPIWFGLDKRDLTDALALVADDPRDDGGRQRRRLRPAARDRQLHAPRSGRRLGQLTLPDSRPRPRTASTPSDAEAKAIVERDGLAHAPSLESPAATSTARTRWRLPHRRRPGDLGARRSPRAARPSRHLRHRRLERSRPRSA